MTNSPFEGEDWEAYVDRVLSELLPKMADSAAVVSIVPTGRSDVKFAVELGFSIMLDKPIIAVIEPGTKVPAKLAMIADRIVEGGPYTPEFSKRLATAIEEVVKEDM